MPPLVTVMSVDKAALQLLVIGGSLGFLGSFAANFLWWQLGTIKNEKIKLWAQWIFGLGGCALFIWLLTKVYNLISFAP